MSERSLKNPPLDELVFGIQFNGRIFSSTDVVSLYLNFFQNNYPVFQEKQLLPNQIELVERSEIRVLQSAESRKQFVHKNDDRVIQIQPDRILFNWRRGKNKSSYPHFQEVFSMFEKEILKNPIIEEKLPLVEQLELTYLDHIEEGFLKPNKYNLSSVFNWFNIEDSRSFQATQSYFKSELNSGIQIAINTAIRNTDKKPVVIFETTVRGLKKDLPLKEWYFLSREEIVKIFYSAIKKELIDKWNKPQN